MSGFYSHRQLLSFNFVDKAYRKEHISVLTSTDV
jgi:hypothetical protein